VIAELLIVVAAALVTASERLFEFNSGMLTLNILERRIHLG
jgi:hypothetical protein